MLGAAFAAPHALRGAYRGACRRPHNGCSLRALKAASNGLWCITYAVTMHRMSTLKPRITITLEPATALQLKRMSELTGNSQSSMVAEVLEQAFPVFDRVIKVLEAAEAARQSAEAAQQSVKIKSIHHLESAQRRIERQMGLVLEDFDDASAPLLAELEDVQRRSRKPARAARVSDTHGTASGAASTPLSNRGVRSAHKATEKIAQNARSEPVSRGRAAKKQGG